MEENGSMSEVKVSVVMPVYNVEKYLRQSLDSVLAQTLSEIEIICVDDGSTDGSYDILEEYAAKDQRITVLKQQNQYAGVARNHGLEKAGGKYVVFWDSDDFFEENALQLLYEQAEKDQAEITVCGANRYDDQLDEIVLTNVYLMQDRLPDKTPFSRQDMGAYIFNFATNVPWNKLYLTAFIKQHALRFEARRQANDTYFVIMAFYYAQKITVVRENLINYRIGTQTSITDQSSQTPFCAYEAYLEILHTLEQQPDYEGALKQSFINRALSGFMVLLTIQTSFESYRMIYDKLLSEGFAAFEIDRHDKDYFHSEWMYEDYLFMQKMKPEDFLLYKFKSTKDELKVKNSRIRKLRERREELKARRDELKEQLREQRKIAREQQGLLDTKTVRFALWVRKILTLNHKIRLKK